MKAIVTYSGDYVGYMLINGVAYAVDQGSTMDYLRNQFKTFWRVIMT